MAQAKKTALQQVTYDTMLILLLQGSLLGRSHQPGPGDYLGDSIPAKNKGFLYTPVFKKSS
jgi:hypothetical protein